MRNLLISLFAAVLLSACATPEQLEAQRRERQARIKAAAEGLQRAIEGKCKSYGFQPGTTAYSSCLMQLDLLTKEQLAKRRARAELESRCSIARGQGFLAPTQSGSFGESLNNANSAYENCMAGLPPQRPVNITCTRQGRDDVHCVAQ